MKNLLLLLSLFFTVHASFSQSYRPFIEEGKYWDVATIDTRHACPISDYNRYFFGEDTLINNLQYSWLNLFPLHELPGGACDLDYAVFDSLSQKSSFLIREDTAEREVFIVYDAAGSNYKEELLFDFSLSPGDTLNALGSLNAILDSVSYWPLPDGDSTRIFFFDRTTLIEGFGSNVAPFDIVRYHEDGWSVQCIKYEHVEWESPFSFWESSCTGAVLKNNGKFLTDFQFHPNPSQGSIRFTGEAIPTSFELLDVHGKLILNSAVPSSGQIELGKQQSGLYFIRLFDERGKLLGYEKLIISSQ